MKMVPSGAMTMLQGSFSESGALPATPGVPMVMRTLPSWSNFQTAWPAGFWSGYLMRSRLLVPRMSTTQMFPSRSW